MEACVESVSPEILVAQSLAQDESEAARSATSSGMQNAHLGRRPLQEEEESEEQTESMEDDEESMEY